MLNSVELLNQITTAKSSQSLQAATAFTTILKIGQNKIGLQYIIVYQYINSILQYSTVYVLQYNNIQ